MNISFTKMSGLGNTFLLIDDDDTKIKSFVPALCDPDFGVGADGVIFLLPPEGAGDFRMRIYNSDGSEAEMCGNGIRCFAAFVQEKRGWTQASMAVETAAGIKEVTADPKGFRVDMGVPILTTENIPLVWESDTCVNAPLSLGDRTYTMTAVSMGNPHVVLHVPQITTKMVQEDGPRIEQMDIFPHKANVEFIRCISPTEVEMRVWERGCGETMACGTGACAAVVAGVLTNRHGTSVTVHLAGGDLHIQWGGAVDDSVYMTGPAKKIFDGSLFLDDLKKTGTM
ncbi:diaminopimelate epimerase [Chitinivibrio alkaliphilus]|uniref:Diaminopimelate epimerase n=1 Tax=Chitinivibrio alkaliphilus ACht1 TaxID=1313304 RepID=U7D8J4_9BACT|nr:diaminopimelate epimerase [Chitinivibrio alkaliphilus]ERP38719.1 Diaminopimelate epimerase [Chitinivibrio alkaliphilus ACht1]